MARLYGAHSYLERIGNPQSAAALSRAEFIGFDTSGVMLDGMNALGLNLTGRNFPVLTRNHLVHWELTKQGVGIGVFPETPGEAEPLVRLVFDLLAEELTR